MHLIFFFKKEGLCETKVIHAPVIGQKGRQRRIDDRQLLLLIFPDILLLLFEIRNRAAPKYYQTTMILPNFLSWVVVGYVTYTMLKPTKQEMPIYLF